MKQAIIFLFIIIIVDSCQKEKIIIPYSQSKIVINSLLTTDSLVNITISKSLLVTDTTLVNDFINNAKVYFYKNNVLIDSLTNQFRDGSWNIGYLLYNPSNYWSNKIYPQSGNEYEIYVKVPGMPDALSKTTIPDLVKIESIDTSRIKFTDTTQFISGDSIIKQPEVNLLCKINFTDPLNEKNYYLIFVYEFPEYWTFPFPFTCNDPIVEEKISRGDALEGIAFSDKSINGKKYSISITLSGNQIGPPFSGGFPSFENIHKTTLYFRLYSINEEYFKFIQTYNLFLANENNPLGVPTQVYSNVQTGYGIFSGASVSSYSIVFHY